MIEATENNFADRPSIYEVEQITWNGGKGERSILLIEAFSINEAVKLSGGEDGVHETIGVRQVGSVCLRSPKIDRDLIKKLFLNNIKITSSQKYGNNVAVCPNRVHITADMDLHFFERELGLGKHLENE